MFQILFFAHTESSFLPLVCSHDWFLALLFVTMSSQCWEYLTDQKLVVQFDSKLTWEIELLISHGILEYLMITKPLKVVGWWWRLYKLSSHFVIDKKNFSSVTVCVEWRSVTQWFPAPKRQLWRKKSIVSHLGFIINLHHLDSCIIDLLMRTNSNWNGQKKWVKQTQ